MDTLKQHTDQPAASSPPLAGSLCGFRAAAIGFPGNHQTTLTPIPSSSNDKVNHLIAFLELTILTRLAWPELRGRLDSRRRCWASGLGIEIIQANLPYREFSLADLAADGAGIAIGLLPWPGIRRVGKPDLRNSPGSL